jgi:hypothetical protein
LFILPVIKQILGPSCPEDNCPCSRPPCQTSTSSESFPPVFPHSIPRFFQWSRVFLRAWPDLVSFPLIDLKRKEVNEEAWRRSQGPSPQDVPPLQPCWHIRPLPATQGHLSWPRASQTLWAKSSGERDVSLHCKCDSGDH